MIMGILKSMAKLRCSIRLRVAVAVLATTLVGCSQHDVSEIDNQDPSQTRVLMSADALVSTSELRLAGLPSVGLDTQGKVKSILDASVTEVPVLCIFKSNDGQTFSQTINWKRTAGTLTLSLESFPITPPSGINFSSAGGRVWYMCGFIGGELDAVNKRIKVSQTALHNGLAPLEQIAVSPAIIPYAFSWTKLSFYTRAGDEIVTPAAGRCSFIPQGTIIRLKLGNKLAATHGINTKAISIQTNAWGDEGYFDFSTGAAVEGSLPQWSFVDSKTIRSTKYTLANSHSLAGGTLVDEAQTYLIWVMPTNVAQPDTKVIFGGEFQDPTIVSPTPYFLTDYVPKSGVQVKPHRLYTLTARATTRVITPLEYISETTIEAPMFGKTDIEVINDPNVIRAVVPSGQHIPTSEESASVFPFPVVSGGVENAPVDPWAINSYPSVQETIRWGTHPQGGYTADYENVGDATYAIRYQGSMFRTAWKYEWIEPDYTSMKVQSKWIPFWEEASLSDIKDPAWWTSGDVQVVTRTFEGLSDFGYFPNGSQGPMGTFPYFAYWGIENDGTMFVYGGKDVESSSSTVATWKTHGFTFDGLFSAISIWVRPFYDTVQ